MRITLALCIIVLAGIVSSESPAEERSDSEGNSGYVLALPVNDDDEEPIAEESQASVATEAPPVTKPPEATTEKPEETNDKEQPILVLVNDESSEKQSRDGEGDKVTTEKPETQKEETTPKPTSAFRRPKFDEIVKILGLPTRDSPIKPKPIPPEKPKMFSPFSKVLPRLPFGGIPFPLPLKRDGSRLFNLPDILHVATSLIKRALIEETQNINKDDKDDDEDDDDDDGPMVLPIPVPALPRPSMMLRSITALPPRPRPIPVPVPRPITYIPHPPPIQRAPPMPSYVHHSAQSMPRIIHHNFIPRMIPPTHPHFQPPPPPPHIVPYRPMPQFVPLHQAPPPVMASHPRPPMHQSRHVHMPFRPAPRPIHPQLMRQQAASVHPVLVLFAPVPVPVPVMHHPKPMPMPVPIAAPSIPQRIVHVPVPQQEEVIFVQQPVAIQQREEYEPNSSDREEVILLYPEPDEQKPTFIPPPPPPKPLYRKPSEGPSPKLKLLRDILMAKQAMNPGVVYGPQPASSSLPLVRQIKMLQIIQHQLRFLPYLRQRA